MIGLAQPQTTAAMGYKSVSQPYTNYLNVTTIKTTFLANRSSALSHGAFAPNEIKTRWVSADEGRVEEHCDGCFMKMRMLLGILLYRFKRSCCAEYL